MSDGPRRRLGHYEVAAVVFTAVIACFALPVVHAYSTLNGVITSPGGLDDPFCLSCHGANRGHVAPPDRSCLSCHATDFDRHLQTSETQVHLDRGGPGLLILIGTYALFCIAILLFLLNPLSVLRTVLLLSSLLGLAGVVAGVFDLTSAPHEPSSANAGQTTARDGWSPMRQLLCKMTASCRNGERQIGAEAQRNPNTWFQAQPGWELDGVFRDSALEVSRDGRYAVVSVRRVDTDGNGRLAAPDRKSLLLLEDGRETYCFGDGVYAYRDRMARWSPDEERLVLALPGPDPGWTPWDASDVVVFDPYSRTELVRYPNGINPTWLWDGLIAFQRADRVVIVDSGHLQELDPAAVVGAGRARLRSIVADPARRRLIVGFEVSRERGEGHSRGVMVEIALTNDDWITRVLPFEGYLPLPTDDGVYSFRPRGDVNGSGHYEVALDGVDLELDGERVVEDVVFHGLYDLAGLRLALVRRNGGFEVQRIEGGRGTTVTTGLVSDGATGFVRQGDLVVLTARRDRSSDATELFSWRSEGSVAQIVAAPALRPQPREEGLYYLRLRGDAPGSLVFERWVE